MKILSLFDGMSCGRIALERAGIKVEKYYASEIDKYAIEISKKNYPDIEHVGDVCLLDAKDFKDIDIIIAGSPCTGFSFAGKQLAFDDPQSKLFFEFTRLLKAIKPKYFLLENVRMKAEYEDIISEQISKIYPEFSNHQDLFTKQIKPYSINSSLLSAQSRERLYWTNIQNIELPKDKGIVLKDILETDVEDEFLAGENLQKNYEGGNQLNPNYKSQANSIHDTNSKSGTICAGTHGYANGYVANFEKKLSKMTTTDKKAFCLTASYSYAEPKNSIQRKQRTMIPAANPTLKEAVSSKRHKIIKKNLADKITEDTSIIGSSQKNAFLGKDKSPSLTEAMGKGGGHVPMVRMTPIKKPKQVGVAQTSTKKKTERNKRNLDEKAVPLLASTYKGIGNNGTTLVPSKDSLVVNSYREVRTDEAKEIRKMTRQQTGKDHTPFRAKKLEPRKDGKVGTVTPSLNKEHEISIEKEELTWRKLTPLECERLQTVPDNYTKGVSNTQRYKMLGNGWTVDVIAHILKYIKK